MLRHVSADGGLADFNAELEQFAMGVGRAPKRIGAAHLTNQIADVGGQLRPSRSAGP